MLVDPNDFRIQVKQAAQSRHDDAYGGNFRCVYGCQKLIGHRIRMDFDKALYPL